MSCGSSKADGWLLGSMDLRGLNMIKEYLRKVIMSVGFIKRLYDQKEMMRISFILMIEWMKKKQGNNHMGDYLKDQGFSKIVIYGKDLFETVLRSELLSDGIEVIDSFEVHALDNRQRDVLREIDAVIVTQFWDIERITDLLRTETRAKVVSLEDLIYEY